MRCWKNSAVAPQVRGCPRGAYWCHVRERGCPAGAGMSLPQGSLFRPARRLPRRCGDVPQDEPDMGLPVVVAPQVRGCPDITVGYGVLYFGCPAGAGMSPICSTPSSRYPRLPRRCGDVPCTYSTRENAERVAPQVRGCPGWLDRNGFEKQGCPAGAGMSLTLGAVTLLGAWLPRRCGDVPVRLEEQVQDESVAPQVRGCPSEPGVRGFALGGCPAGAGMSRLDCA